jgi:hypothetical protein
MVSTMNKFNTKLCAVLGCFLIQGSWAITWETTIDPIAQAGVYDFGWHVFTVTAKPFGSEDKSFTVDMVDGTVADKKNPDKPVRADIKDINCGGKKFERAGDSCKFKARIPEQFTVQAASDPKLTNITFNIKYFFNNATIEVYNNDKYTVTNLKNLKPIVRVADVEEKNDYPALGVPNPENDYGTFVAGNGGEPLKVVDHYGVLVVENGGTEPLAVMDRRYNSSGNFQSVNRKNPNSEVDPLYGTNIECIKDLELKKVNDSCIIVYKFTPDLTQTTFGVSVLPNKEVRILIGRPSSGSLPGGKSTLYPKTVSAIVSGPVKFMVGPLEKAGFLFPGSPVVVSWNTKISYFGKESIDVNVYAVNEKGEKIFVYDPYFEGVSEGMWETKDLTVQVFSNVSPHIPVGKYRLLIMLPDGTAYYPAGTEFEVKPTY